MAATRREAFITDLSQIKEKKLPVRILSDNSIRAQMILNYYGIRARTCELGRRDRLAGGRGSRALRCAPVVCEFTQQHTGMERIVLRTEPEGEPALFLAFAR